MRRGIVLVSLAVFAFLCLFLILEGQTNSQQADVSACNTSTNRVAHDSLGRKDAISKKLLEYADRFKLDELETREFSQKEFEMRVWVGFGGIVPRAFIFNQGSQGASAVFYTEKYQSDHFTVTKKDVSKEVAATALMRYLDKIEILSKKWRPDRQHLADPDEEMIVVEIKSSHHYDLIQYPKATKDRDGRIILDLLRWIQRTFDVRLV